MIADGGPIAPEARLLCALADVELPVERQRWCRDWLAAHARDLDWGAFVDLACWHRLLPLVGHHIVRYRLHRDGNRTLIPHYWLYGGAYHANLDRNRAQWTEHRTVLAALCAAEVAFAIRKGFLQALTYYGDPGLRRMEDLDVLVRQEDVPRVHAVLAGAGYVQGEVSRAGAEPVPYSRGTRAFWSLWLNNLLPYRKASGRLDMMAYIVDVCLSVLPAKQDPDRATPAMLEARRSRRLFDLDVPALRPVDHLIDLCLHLFKEANAQYYIDAGKDLELGKLLDLSLVCTTIGAAGEWPQFLRRVAELGVDDEVRYALTLTRIFYPRAVPPDDVAAFASDTPRGPDEYGGIGGHPDVWKSPIVARMFQPQRHRELSEESTVARATRPSGAADPGAGTA